MVSFRPHTLDIKVSAKGSYDSLGKYIQGSETIISGIECRYEPNGRANSIVLEDGKAFVYSYMVYLDVDCPNIAYGDLIELFNQDGISIGEFTAKGFHRGQLNAKLWL